MTGDYGQVAKHIETNAEGVIATTSSIKFFGVSLRGKHRKT